MMMNSHVMLVAFEVRGNGWQEAQENLIDILPKPSTTAFLDCWWIAEDTRFDGSDCDSAVFVPMGRQDASRASGSTSPRGARTLAGRPSSVGLCRAKSATQSLLS